MIFTFLFPGGFYCDTVGSAEPNGLCAAGHFCTIGVDTPSPDGTSNFGVGGVCPTGNYCPQASAVPIPCEAGTYNFATGRSTCEQCPSGYYCEQNTTDPTSDPCPTGHYCPPGWCKLIPPMSPMCLFNDICN